MTQDEIIKMARQVGFSQTEGLFRTLYICSPSDLKAFAKLVASKERDEIVKDFMARHKEAKHSHNFWHVASNQVKTRGIEA